MQRICSFHRMCSSPGAVCQKEKRVRSAWYQSVPWRSFFSFRQSSCKRERARLLRYHLGVFPLLRAIIWQSLYVYLALPSTQCNFPEYKKKKTNKDEEIHSLSRPSRHTRVSRVMRDIPYSKLIIDDSKISECFLSLIKYTVRLQGVLES